MSAQAVEKYLIPHEAEHLALAEKTKNALARQVQDKGLRAIVEEFVVDANNLRHGAFGQPYAAALAEVLGLYLTRDWGPYNGRASMPVDEALRVIQHYTLLASAGIKIDGLTKLYTEIFDHLMSEGGKIRDFLLLYLDFMNSYNQNGNILDLAHVKYFNEFLKSPAIPLNLIKS